MATRRLTFSQWLRAIAPVALEDRFKNLAGYPSADVADRLGVSRQRVEQLVGAGTLDTIEIVNKKGQVSMVLITEASVDRYLADRVPDRGRQGYFAFPSA